MAIDILAIGDTVVDDFIRLENARVSCTIKDDTCEICMRWGDKIPFESSEIAFAVGNASNAAVSAARLGLSTALRAYVGDDHYGAECIKKLESEGVDTSFIVTEPDKRTNYHYVLWFESERTILVKHEEYAYTVPELAEPPKWVYLSSLGANSLPYHGAISEMLAKMPETKLAFQPGTFQMELGVDALRPLYERSEVFVCNKEEAALILKLDGPQPIEALLAGMRALCPRIVVITDGTEGAYAFDGERRLRVPMYPDARGPFERTGAGDAFASTLVSALALGRPLDEALLWAPINSMAVVQQVAAQKGLLSRAEIEKYIADAPDSYALTEF